MASADRLTIAHLLRRTGFGPTAAEVDAATARGYDATVGDLVDFSKPDPDDPPTFAPIPQQRSPLTKEQRQARAREVAALQRWWVTRMATTAHPLREKLTWFWHGHFATSAAKVRLGAYMYRQNQIFRSGGAGDFEALTQAVAKDPAMMIWLDTRTDKAAHPNENFARELMELFTLGIGNYSEADVREAARAFTGWVIDPVRQSWALRPAQHDRGTKTVLGHTGAWGGEDVIHLLVNSPASAAFVVARVWSHFAYPVSTTDPVVSALAPGYAKDRNVANLVRAVLTHPQFISPQARTGLVKQPVEWVIGSLRALGLPAGDARVITALRSLGQVPFLPPSVGGWPQNDYWLNTGSSFARLRIAGTIAKAADLSALAATPVSARTDAVGHLLSVGWSASTAKALAAVAGNPAELVTLALVAPDYVLA